MSVEDVIKEVKQAAKEIIPSHINISKIAVESSNVILYTKDTDFISGNNDSVRSLAQKVRKRIIVRADASARKPIISSKPKISKIIPEEAEVQNVTFDEVNGDVIIEAINPGKAIGKQGSVLNEIRKEIGWNPVVIRHPPMKSQKLTETRKFLLEPKTASKRKDFLKQVGKKVFRDTTEGEQYVRITALGGYREVGRSCHLLSTKDSKILIDCGVNPGNDKAPSPFLQVPEVTPLEGIDAVVLTHAHLDHSALLPMLFLYGYDGPVYCTPPTRDLAMMLQMDYIKIQNAESNRAPYSSEHIRTSITHTIPINFGETTDIAPDIKLTFHNSGHILGSASAHFHVGDGQHNVVFSGDIKYENTWLFDKAVNRFPRMETLVMESTYGGYNDYQPSREEGMRGLTEIIKRTVARKGKILIPVFAVGRSQEVMLVLERACMEGKLDNMPVYLDGMIWEATALHSAYPEYLNNNLRNKIYQQNDNPFNSEMFHKIESVEMRQEVCNRDEPVIVLATAGMVNGGPVLEYLRHWAPDSNNSMVFVGYQAVGTLGHRLQQGAQEVSLSDREKGGTVQVKVNMNMETCEGFSGHSDKRQLMRYLRTIKPRPKQVILNHGDEKKSLQLANDINRKLKMDALVPYNLETLRLL
tara:strand:- start:2425 stop:4347 length:1923 start_codon:yes stop_codon:yes gene_type:complete